MIVRVTAFYTENPHDTITLLCAVDAEGQICQGEWFGVVKNSDNLGDESNYPFTLNIDYERQVFFIDYGFDDAEVRQQQSSDIASIKLQIDNQFTIIDSEESEEYCYQIRSIHRYE